MPHITTCRIRPRNDTASVHYSNNKISMSHITTCRIRPRNDTARIHYSNTAISMPHITSCRIRPRDLSLNVPTPGKLQLQITRISLMKNAYLLACVLTYLYRAGSHIYLEFNVDFLRSCTEKK